MTNFPLWQHQKDVLEVITERFNRGKNWFGLFWEQGCGKSRATIEVLKYIFFKELFHLKTLILCPAIVVPNWKNEIERYSDFGEDVYLLRGPGNKRVSDLISKQGKKKIFVTNYEILATNKAMEKAILEWQPEILIADEIHRCKNHSSKRTRSVLRIAEKAKYRLGLSGTPVLNSPMDLFSQYKILDHGENFGNNFYAFRNTYFFDANARMPRHVHFPNWKIKPNSIEQINTIINETSSRVTKEECLDLPPLVKQRIEVPLSNMQKSLYNQMKEDFLAFLEESDDVSVAKLAVTKSLRLQQIVSGFLKVESGEERTIPEIPRLNTLKDLLSELAPYHKVIVWACFIKNYEHIEQVCKSMKIKCVKAHGGISDKKKQEAIKSFNTNDRTRVFIAHPGSLGIGINLTVSNYSIYYSRSFSLEHDLQSEARNHRGGSEIHEKITRIDLVTPNTIDEVILDALSRKEQISGALLKSKVSQI